MKVYRGLKRRGKIQNKSTQNEHLLESRSHGTSGRPDLQPPENLKQEEDEGRGAAQELSGRSQTRYDAKPL
jgi:hypothetical protein